MRSLLLGPGRIMQRFAYVFTGTSNRRVVARCRATGLFLEGMRALIRSIVASAVALSAELWRAAAALLTSCVTLRVRVRLT